MSLILVTGAAGKTGQKVVSALASHNADIRAFVRREEAGEAMKSLGAAEVFVGDFFERGSLEAAIDGCAQVIHICPPMNPREADLARLITDLCKAGGVERLILYSALHPLLRGVRHHALKLDAEQYLVESGQPYTILQPCRYMQHLTPIWKNVVESGVHAMPFSIDAKFSVTDLNDVAEAAALVATEDGHEGATYELAGPDQLSQVDMARIISSVIGKPIRAETKSPEDYCRAAEAAGMSADRIKNLVSMNEHYDSHGLIGNSNVLRWILGREPTNFATFVERDLKPQIK